MSPVTDGVKEAELVKHMDDLTGQFAAKGYKLDENEVKKVNGHSLNVLSFYSDVAGGKIFNRRFIAVAGSKLILITFNTTSDDLEKRQE